MRDLLIGIDLGTTGCKAIVSDLRLNVLGEAYIEYGLIKHSSKEIEQDACEWWDMTKKVIRQAVVLSRAEKNRFKGISISSQGIAFVPVDDNCQPLRNAFSWLDIRAEKEIKEIARKYDEKEVFDVTGKRLSAAYTLPKIMWFKQNEPELYEKTFKFLLPHDYILAKLCGEYVTDHTMASGTLAFDIRKRKWWDEILTDFGILEEKFPEVRYSGSIAGKIIKSVADELGLPDNLIICVGGQDQKCAALGAGIDNDNMTISLGTASAIERLCNNNVIQKDMEIPLFAYLFENKWIMEGVVSTSGISLKWFKDLFFNDISYNEIDHLISSSMEKETDVFFFPYLSGTDSPNWFKDPKGCFYGMSLDTDSGDMARSIIEGISFQLKSNIKTIEKMTTDISVLRVFGGGAKSDIWCQTISNITNIKVQTLAVAETAGIGACILAGIGTGVIDLSNLDLKIKRTFEPEKTKVEMYEKKYIGYIRIENKIMT